MSKNQTTTNEIVLKGIPASNGVAIGQAFVFSKAKVLIEERTIDKSEIPDQIAKLKNAFEQTKNEILTHQEKLKLILGEKDSQIFDAHILILNDKEFFREIEKNISIEQKNVEFVFNKTIKKYIDAISSMPDPYFRERATDIKDIAERVLQKLINRNPTAKKNDKFTGQRIIIADDITPTDIAEIDKEKILAIVSETGGKTSHTAIIARSLGIPAVLGVKEKITEIVKTGNIVVVDGYFGSIIINPSENTLQLYAKKETKDEELHSELLNEIRLRPETIDGFRIQLAANIEYLDEAELAIKYGAAGIGLMRTEYLILSSDPPQIPSEEEQFNIYSKLARTMQGQHVIIRTFDIGGDKLTSILNCQHEPNPFLGWRAIRIFLEHKDIFKAQLRAILRAAVYGNVKIMFPMVSFLEEINQISSLIEEAKSELKNKNIPYDDKIQFGAMIETPSAALIADKIAPKVDFFSIGTNDLTQYTLSVDRTNSKIADLYQPAHPSILKLIHKTVSAAKQNGIWVSVCGETASDPIYAPLLIGLGINELSMTPSAIPTIRRLIRKLKFSQLEQIVDIALNNSTAEENILLAKELINKSAPEILSMREI